MCQIIKFLFILSFSFLLSACGGGNEIPEIMINVNENFLSSEKNNSISFDKVQEEKNSVLVSNGEEFKSRKIEGKIYKSGTLKSPLKNASLKIYEMNVYGQRVALIANSSTDANGYFKIYVPAKDYVAIELEARDGVFVNEYQHVEIEERVSHIILKDDYQEILF